MFDWIKNLLTPPEPTEPPFPEKVLKGYGVDFRYSSDNNVGQIFRSRIYEDREDAEGLYAFWSHMLANFSKDPNIEFLKLSTADTYDDDMDWLSTVHIGRGALERGVKMMVTEVWDYD